MKYALLLLLIIGCSSPTAPQPKPFAGVYGNWRSLETLTDSYKVDLNVKAPVWASDDTTASWQMMSDANVVGDYTGSALRPNVSGDTVYYTMLSTESISGYPWFVKLTLHHDEYDRLVGLQEYSAVSSKDTIRKTLTFVRQ
jgi:hypothetical protein